MQLSSEEYQDSFSTYRCIANISNKFHKDDIYKVKYLKSDPEVSEPYKGATLATAVDHGNGIVINYGPDSVNLDYAQAEELYALFKTMFEYGGKGIKCNSTVTLK